MRGLTRRARPLLSHRARGVARAVASQLGLRRRVRLLEGDHDALPMTWGVLRPALLLPRGAGDWPARRLEAVLRHELAHVRRLDALTLLAAQLACVLYWPNPLVWLAARRLRIEQEHACDDVVLRAGSRASDYAAELLAMARLLRGRRTAPLAAIAMAHRAQIEPRLAAVLDETRSRDVSRRWLRLACAAAAAVILPLAALEPARAQLPPPAPSAPRPTATPSAAPAPVAEPAGRTAPVAVPAPESRPPAVMPAPPAVAPYRPVPPGIAPRAAAFIQEGCWPGASGVDRMNHRSDDDVRVITWSGRRCSGAIRIEGEIRFTDDLTGIAAISPGGLLRFEHDDGRTSRRVTIRPSAGGLEYEYRVDGRERPWDDEGRAWFADALEQIFRTTGLAADERVDLLLRQGGPGAVLAEVELMSSDYVQRLYLSKLLEKASLDDAQLNAAVAVAGRELSSDHHLAEFLVGLAAVRELDAATRATLIAATRSIESDHHHRRVLEAALARSDLTPEDVAAIVAEAQRIGSDHHRAELLLGLARRYPLDPAARRAYLAAASKIGSDHHKRRVFESLLARGALAPAELAQVLDAAASIRSDHHRADLLLALVGSDFADPAFQQAFVKASADIDSDHHLRRALAGLMERQTLTPEALDVVLTAAAKIDSDHHLSELLLEVVRNHTLTPAQRERVIRMLDSIDSETYRGRVATALLQRGT